MSTITVAECRRAVVWAGWTCNADALRIHRKMRRPRGRGEEAGGKSPAFFFTSPRGRCRPAAPHSRSTPTTGTDQCGAAG